MLWGFILKIIFPFDWAHSSRTFQSVSIKHCSSSIFHKKYQIFSKIFELKMKMFGVKLLICVFLVTKPVLSKNSSVCSVQKLKNIANNVSTSILYGILRASIEYPRTGECNRELNRMLDGIHNSELWAIKAMDSSAMPQPGFVLGQNFLFGSAAGCRAVQMANIVTISKRFKRYMDPNLLTKNAPIQVKYRMVYAKHQSPHQIQVEFVLNKRMLHIGLCVPKSCSNEDIANLTQTFFELSDENEWNPIEYRASVVSVKDFTRKTIFLDKISFRILGLWILFSLLLGLSAYEWKTSGAIEKPIDAGKFIECFSVQKNWNRLFCCEVSKDAVPAVDGLRSISCIIILIFHSCYFGHFVIENAATMLSIGEHIHWQWIMTAPLAVDVFFTISGFLLTYNFLRNQNKVNEIRCNTFSNNLKLFGKQLLSRYLRLTPPYVATILATSLLTDYSVESSPFWISDRNDIKCSQHWWRNLSYIQNMFDFDELCVIWSWSLACEMQFFVIITALLFLYAKNEILAKKVFFGLFIFALIIFPTVTAAYKIRPSYDVLYSVWNEFYMPPWMRIIPYLIGTVGGYLNYQLKNKLNLTDKIRDWLWYGTAAAIIGTHFATTVRTFNISTNVVLITLIRLAYPASIVWIIIASCNGFSVKMLNILNTKFFIHLNKLSYTIYLLNPLVIIMVLGLRDHSIHFDVLTWSALNTAIIVFVYCLAIVMTLIFEMPYVNLATMLLKPKPKPKPAYEAEEKMLNKEKSI